MVQKVFVWAVFPLAVALLFGVVWAVGNYVAGCLQCLVRSPWWRAQASEPNLVLADNNNLWHIAYGGWDRANGSVVRPVPPDFETPRTLGRLQDRRLRRLGEPEGAAAMTVGRIRQ